MDPNSQSPTDDLIIKEEDVVTILSDSEDESDHLSSIIQAEDDNSINKFQRHVQRNAFISEGNAFLRHNITFIRGNNTFSGDASTFLRGNNTPIRESNTFGTENNSISSNYSQNIFLNSLKADKLAASASKNVSFDLLTARNVALKTLSRAVSNTIPYNFPYETFQASLASQHMNYFSINKNSNFVNNNSFNNNFINSNPTDNNSVNNNSINNNNCTSKNSFPIMHIKEETNFECNSLKNGHENSPGSFQNVLRDDDEYLQVLKSTMDVPKDNCFPVMVNSYMNNVPTNNSMENSVNNSCSNSMNNLINNSMNNSIKNSINNPINSSVNNCVNNSMSTSNANLYPESVEGSAFSKNPELIKEGKSKHILPMIIMQGAKFMCSFCNKEFLKKQQLENHLKIHIGMKNFECSICQKRFIHKQQLENHVKTHTGDKKFVCEICSKRFIHKQQLENHRKIHTGQKDFECADCMRKFTHKQQLQNHIKIHLGIKEFVCEYCQKRFTLKQQLLYHIKMHLGVKDFVCSVCDRAFVTKQQLDSHFRIHSGLKPYNCLQCNQNFPRPQQLQYHVNKGHCGQVLLKGQSLKKEMGQLRQKEQLDYKGVFNQRGRGSHLGQCSQEELFNQEGPCNERLCNSQDSEDLSKEVKCDS